MRLVVATRNRGKVIELARLLDGVGVELIDLAAAGVTEELAESGQTFAANAVQKAERTRDLTGLPALADDSGLCVDALGGRPGVYSARYGGPGLSDAGRVERLLSEMNDVPRARRGAQFVCVLALAQPGWPTLTVTGAVGGRIAAIPAGSGGFGYDPVFLLPELGVTTAQLAAEAKDALSHRGRAAALLRPVLARLSGGVGPGGGDAGYG